MPSADEQAHGGKIEAAGPEPVAHVTDLDVVLARRASPRRRVVTALLVGAALLIAVGLVLRGLLPANSSSVPPPTVVVISNLSFGTISINGQRLVSPSDTASLLHDGSNTLALDAPPFQVPPCTVRWPVATNALPTPRLGDCPIVLDQPDRQHTTMAIELLANGYDLPPDLRESAFAAVALSYANIRLPVVTVPAGDYIASGMDNQGRILSQRAPTTLTATPSLERALATDPVPGPQFTDLVETCSQLVCPATTPPPEGGGQHWNIGSAVTLVWRFTDATGKLVASARYALPFVADLTLTYLGDGSWLVTKDSLSLGYLSYALASACDLGVDQLRLVPGYLTARIDETPTPGAEDGHGCVLQAANPQGGIAGTFIWRFGVLLAGDLQAHLLVPWLPVAPADEIAAVQT